MLTSILGIERLAHIWQVVASILLGGALTALAYGLSEAGLSEIAGTMLAFYGVFVATRLFSKVAAGERGGHFSESKKLLRQAQQDMREWMTDRTILSIFILGIPAALGYVMLRAACIALLGVFSNLWFALAAGLGFAAVIASPILIRDIGRIVTRDHHGPQQAATPSQRYSVPQPAPAPQEASQSHREAPKYVSSVLDTGEIPTIRDDSPVSPYSTPQEPHSPQESQEAPESPSGGSGGSGGSVRAGTGGDSSTPL